MVASPEALLDHPGESSTKTLLLGNLRRRFAFQTRTSVVFIVLIATVVSSAGVLFTSRSRALHSSHGLGLVVNSHGWGNATCYRYTGGGCAFLGCNANRNATCDWGRCMCDGMCVGADGLCVHQTNALVSEHFTLRNVRWPDQYIYVPTNPLEEQLRVDRRLRASSFTLRRLPGVYTKNGSKQVMYFLQPDQLPEYAVGVGNSKLGFLSLWPAYVYHMTSRPLFFSPYDPENMMLSLCRPKGYSKALRIDMAGSFSMYIHPGSWEVFGWVWSDPGSGGYWEPEPPINATFPDC